MKVGNITRYGQSGQGLPGGPVADVGRDAADDLNALGLCRIHDGAAAHSVDRDAVYQVRVAPFLTGADVSREETERIGRHCWKTKPSDFCADHQRGRHWQQWYQVLWKIKQASFYQDHR